VRWLCLDLHCQAVHDWGRVEGPVLLDDQLYSPGSLQNRWIRSLSHLFVVAAGGLRRLGTTVWVNMRIIIHDVQTSFWLCRILWFNYHMVNFITNTSDKRNPNHNLGQTWWFLAIELHDQFRSKQHFRQIEQSQRWLIVQTCPDLEFIRSLSGKWQLKKKHKQEYSSCISMCVFPRITCYCTNQSQST
jgi:hypothetical protein